MARTDTYSLRLAVDLSLHKADQELKLLKANHEHMPKSEIDDVMDRILGQINSTQDFIGRIVDRVPSLRSQAGQ